MNREINRQQRRRQLVRCIRLLLIASLFLVLLFANWRASTQITSRVQQSAQADQATPGIAQPISSTSAAPELETTYLASQVDSLLTDEVNHQQFSGSVLIAHEGQILLSKGYSMANWTSQTPNTPATKFYLGSTTKQFTAIAILILQERGKLHVRDRLCTYIASCPSAWQAVTIHELLTHTSGIASLTEDDLSGTSPQSWVASYGSIPMVSSPGGQYSYCNTCYQLLGYVVQQVSHEPYSSFLQQAIFAPLHMRDTGFDSQYLATPAHAVGYASWQVNAALNWSITPQWSFLFASGLLYSTVEDLYRWDQALYTHALVSQRSLNEAFTPYIVSQYAGSSYGYGWFIAKAPLPGHRLIWHDGRIDGFRTFIGRYINDQVTIIILSNLATVDELALAQALERLVFGEYEHQRLPVYTPLLPSSSQR